MELRVDTISYINEIREYRRKEEWESAQKRMDELMGALEEFLSSGGYQETDRVRYFTFAENFEYILHNFYFHSDKQVRNTDDIPVAFIYFEYGCLLIDLGELDKAREMLEKALHWNPINTLILFEYIETYKYKKEWEPMLALTIDAMKYAFDPKQIAHGYRNIGFYLIEMEKWQEAMGCYFLSMVFDPDFQGAQDEIDYIMNMTDGNVEHPTEEQLEQYAKEYGFTLGPNEDILNLAMSIGNQRIEQDAMEDAKYYFQIVYNLTGSEEIGLLLEEETPWKS